MLKISILTMWTSSGVSGLLMLSAGLHIIVPDANMSAKELNVIIFANNLLFFAAYERFMCNFYVSLSL